VEGSYLDVMSFQMQMIQDGYTDITLYVPNPTANPLIAYFMRKQ